MRTIDVSRSRALPRRHAACALLTSLVAAACSAAPGDESSQNAEAVSGSSLAIDVGFNGGADQFGYFPDFFGASLVHPGPRLCHWYVRWNVAEEPAAMGDDSSPQGSRPYLEHWLAKAQGQCDEALISFQADAPTAAPSESAFRSAFKAFVDTDWAQQTGFSGHFSFTPWNEPNNPGAAGNGLGTVLDPRTAAQYYLVIHELCAQHGCKVAAGDLASNGAFWNDFEWNCSDDNVSVGSLCKTPSSLNTSRPPLAASYLDRYKNYIVNLAKSEYGLDNFRPEIFAYHGWHDANDYLNDGNHCDDYGDCVTRRVLQSLGGSWGGVQIWDTEVGVEQGSTQISDGTQACGAAFLLRLTAIDRRITRLYYTRLHGGGGELLDGHTPRLALKILAARKTQAPGSCR